MVWPTGQQHDSAAQSKRGRDSQNQSERGSKRRPNGGANKGQACSNFGGHFPAPVPAAMAHFSFKTVNAYQSKGNHPLVPAVDSEESMYFLGLTSEALDMIDRDHIAAGLAVHPAITELRSALDTVEYPREMQDLLEYRWAHCGQLWEEPVFDGMLNKRDPNHLDRYGNNQTEASYQPENDYECYKVTRRGSTANGHPHADQTFVQEPRDEVRGGSGSSRSNTRTASAHASQPLHSPHAVSHPPPAARAAS